MPKFVVGKLEPVVAEPVRVWLEEEMGDVWLCAGNTTTKTKVLRLTSEGIVCRATISGEVAAALGLQLTRSSSIRGFYDPDE